MNEVQQYVYLVGVISGRACGWTAKGWRRLEKREHIHGKSRLPARTLVFHSEDPVGRWALKFDGDHCRFTVREGVCCLSAGFGPCVVHNYLGSLKAGAQITIDVQTTGRVGVFIHVWNS